MHHSLVDNSMQDDHQQLEDPHELEDTVPAFNTVNVSEFLKSASRLNKSLSTAMTEKNRSDGLNSRLSNFRSKQSFDENMENIEPSVLVVKLKQQLHESHKREANQRLQISKLKSCLDQLTKQAHKLRQELFQSDSKITKNNEYILKLDNQLRLCREETDKYRKQSLLHKDYDELLEENKQMRFVIEQLLREREEDKPTGSHRGSLDKRQNIAELMKDLRTYPSSESSRGSTRKQPTQQNFFQLTMNPRAYHLIEKDSTREQRSQEPQESQSSLNERIRMKVLSVINQDMEEGASKAPTDEYIRSRINQLASLNQEASCGRSFMYQSQDE